MSIQLWVAITAAVVITGLIIYGLRLVLHDEPWDDLDALSREDTDDPKG